MGENGHICDTFNNKDKLKNKKQKTGYITPHCVDLPRFSFPVSVSISLFKSPPPNTHTSLNFQAVESL